MMMCQLKKMEFLMKMNFNPDLSKQTQEVIFSKRTKKVNHPTHIFNNNFVAQITFQKHFGVAFASRLTFHDHLKRILINTLI